jgi:hypothetical protein
MPNVYLALLLFASFDLITFGTECFGDGWIACALDDALPCVAALSNCCHAISLVGDRRVYRLEKLGLSE